MTAREILETTDWAHLAHAYGPAGDLADLLRSLVEDNPEAWDEAAHGLWEATVHQGRVFDSTPPVVRFLTRWVVERTGEEWDGAAPYIALMCLHGSGQAAREAPADDPLASCAPEVLDLLTPLALDPSHPADGIIAAALVPWTGVLGSHPRAVMLRTRLDNVMDADGAPREWRGLAVLGLGELGQDVSRFLDDPDPAIRTCAALTSTGARAVEILQETSALGEGVEEWFDWTVSFRLVNGVAVACELELRARQG